MNINKFCYVDDTAGSILSKFANSFSPLYFTIRETTEVMSTEQPCDLAYEFGNGLLDLYQYPPGFPTAGQHHLNHITIKL